MARESLLPHDLEYKDIRATQVTIPYQVRIHETITTTAFLLCQHNIEASISSLYSEQSDTKSTSQIEVHRQGIFCRSFTEDLVGMAGRTEVDSFVRVTWKDRLQAIDIPYTSSRITRSQLHGTTSHVPSL